MWNRCWKGVAHKWWGFEFKSPGRWSASRGWDRCFHPQRQLPGDHTSVEEPGRLTARAKEDVGVGGLQWEYIDTPARRQGSEGLRKAPRCIGHRLWAHIDRPLMGKGERVK